MRWSVGAVVITEMAIRGFAAPAETPWSIERSRRGWTEVQVPGRRLTLGRPFPWHIGVVEQ